MVRREGVGPRRESRFRRGETDRDRPPPRLRFSGRVFVCLIPTRGELLRSGFGGDLYWSSDDFAGFRWEAEAEIEGAAAVLGVSRAEAMTELYQPEGTGLLEAALDESEALLCGVWGALGPTGRRSSIDLLGRDGCVDEVQAALRTRTRSPDFRRLLWVVTWKCSPLAAMQC